MGSSAPAGPAEQMLYRQGTILAWNPVTLEHRIRIGGEGGPVFENLQVLGVSDASLIQTNSVVGVACVGSSWAILGRLVTPGSAEAADAISLLSARTRSQTVDTQETTASTVFTDLATPGPEVTISVGPSGRVLAVWSSKIGWAVFSASPACGGAMSIGLTGANVIAASDTWRAAAHSQKGGVNFDQAHGTYTASKVFEGLTPGDTTFTAKYRAFPLMAPDPDFQTRTLTVISL